MEVQVGKDGQVRRAIVRTKDGILSRPAVKLALLDIQVNRKQDMEKESPELHGRGDVKNTDTGNRGEKVRRNVSSERSPCVNRHRFSSGRTSGELTATNVNINKGKRSVRAKKE